MQKNVYFLIRNTFNAAKHKLRQVFVEHFFSLKYIIKALNKLLTSVPWKDHLKDLRVWLREGGISSWRRLMLTIWESSETHKEGNTLRGLTPNFHYWADANTRADTYKSSFNPENGLDARARMCKSALEDIYFSLFSFSCEMTKFSLL